MYTTNNRNFVFSLRRFVNRIPSATFFLAMIFFALIFFELFNYSTTQYALADLLGGLNFLFLPWSTILALAFCGIDFAGIARLLSPSRTDSKETWFLFGAWLIAATMNAILTWWGVAMAMSNHSLGSLQVMDSTALMHAVPVFIAVMVWLIRILIIGSITYAVNRILGKGTVQNIQAVSVNHGKLTGNFPAAPQKVPAGFHPIPFAPKPDPVYTDLNIPQSQPDEQPVFKA